MLLSNGVFNSIANAVQGILPPLNFSQTLVFVFKACEKYTRTGDIKGMFCCIKESKLVTCTCVVWKSE